MLPGYLLRFAALALVLILQVRLTCTLSVASSTHKPAKPESEDLLRDLSLDLEKLTELRPPIPSADHSATTAIISAGSSYTRIWTSETWSAHSRPPHVRYARHVYRWRHSSTARKILPAVLISTCWSALCSIVAKTHYPQAALLAAKGPSTMIGLLAAPLLLLLTLRANASLGRLLEARLLWGGLVLHARSLASLLRIKFFPEFPEAATLTVRYLSMYGWIVKAYVRGESKESEKEVLRTMLGDDTQDVQWLESQKKRTVAVTSRIRQLCGSMLDRLQDRSTASALQYIIDDKIAALETVVGGCERLFTSPIPPTYSRHLSRVLTIWILLMPMSFIAMGLSTAAVSASSAVASYVLIGIDEVGMEIENVFTLLPLQQLAGAVQNDVRDQFVPDMPEVPFPL